MSLLMVVKAPSLLFDYTGCPAPITWPIPSARRVHIDGTYLYRPVKSSFRPIRQAFFLEARVLLAGLLGPLVHFGVPDPQLCP